MSAPKTNSKRVPLLPGQAIVNRDPDTGELLIRVGGNPDGTVTAKGHRSYASTKGWGQGVVILDADGNQTPAVLRCSLSAK